MSFDKGISLQRSGGKSGGFTLIEVLASMLFLAILVPAIAGGLTLSNRISVITARRAVALELAENKLNEQLVANNWQTATANNGDFGDDHPGFHWTVTQAGWGGDTLSSMTELSVEVFFPVQGQEQSVRLSTLVSVADTSQTTATGQTSQ